MRLPQRVLNRCYLKAIPDFERYGEGRERAPQNISVENNSFCQEIALADQRIYFDKSALRVILPSLAST